MQINNIEEIQQDTVIVPHLEQNIPIPKNARDALPNLNDREELEMIANTVKLLSDLSGDPIEPTQEDIKEAKTVAEAIVKHPETKHQLKKYKSTVLASLAGMVAEIDAAVVDDLSELKTVVVNGLLREAMTSDKSKERITAFRALGEIEGVNAFKKHVEVVHTNTSLDEIEDKLRALVNKIQKRLETKDVEGEVIENGE